MQRAFRTCVHGNVNFYLSFSVTKWRTFTHFIRPITWEMYLSEAAKWEKVLIIFDVSPLANIFPGFGLYFQKNHGRLQMGESASTPSCKMSMHRVPLTSIVVSCVTCMVFQKEFSLVVFQAKHMPKKKIITSNDSSMKSSAPGWLLWRRNISVWWSF